MRKFIRWYIIDAGTLTTTGDIVKYSFSVPSNCKRLLGTFIFSNEIASLAATYFDVHFSLSINNREKNPCSGQIGLGRNDDDDIQSRVLYLDEELVPAQNITGYIEKLVDRGTGAYNVKVYLKCGCEEPLTDKQKEVITTNKTHLKQEEIENKISQKEPIKEQIKKIKQQIII